MLATFIRSDQEHILKEWDKFARSLPGGECMSQVSVRNHGQKILAAIADDIESPQDSKAQTQKSRGKGQAGPLDAIASVHSAMRLEQGFDFTQLMAEFRALRATVMRLWEVRVGDAGNRDIDGIVRFNEAIDQVVTEAISDHIKVTSEYRDRFTRMIGHDLRTPLTVIKLSAKYLQETRHQRTEICKACVPHFGRRKPAGTHVRRLARLYAFALWCRHPHHQLAGGSGPCLSGGARRSGTVPLGRPH